MLSSGPTVPCISKYSIDISWYNFVTFSNVRTSLDRKYENMMEFLVKCMEFFVFADSRLKHQK